MYDTRTRMKIMSVNHDAPVESVLFLPSGGIILSAGGTEIKVWDCLNNGRLLAKISQHHKTITCLQVTSNGHRIISGSLDRSIKMYDSTNYKLLHSINYSNSILSIGISPDDKTIVAGMIDGMISIRQKENIIEKLPSQQKQSFKYSAKSSLHQILDEYIPEEKREVLSKHDIHLRKFQYSKALDSVMINYVSNKTPQITIAVFQELIRRQGLNQALAGRDGKSLTNILKFLNRFIGSTRFGRMLLYITNAIIDIYGDKLEELSLESQVAFKFLEKKLEIEQELIVSLLELRGSFEMIMSATETAIPVFKSSCRLTPSSNAQKDLVLNL